MPLLAPFVITFSPRNCGARRSVRESTPGSIRTVAGGRTRAALWNRIIWRRIEGYVTSDEYNQDTAVGIRPDFTRQNSSGNCRMDNGIKAFFQHCLDELASQVITLEFHS